MASPSPSSSAADVATAYFRDWEQGQYGQMYSLLGQGAQASISQDAFVRRYTNIHTGIGEQKLTVQSSSVQPGPGVAASPLASSVPSVAADASAHAPYQVARTLFMFGDLVESNDLPLVRENGTWRVDWQPGLIFSGLTATSTVQVTTLSSVRGRVLDRHGQPLANNGNELSVGVVPGQITNEQALLQAVSSALSLTPDAVKQLYQGGQPDWFMPIADRPESDRPALQQVLGSIDGVVIQDKSARAYPLGDAAAHLIGYVAHPSADQLTRLSSQGYDETDWVGQAGIEAAAQQQLAGAKGGTISIIADDDSTIRTVVHKDPTPGSDVTLSIDADIQRLANQTLGDVAGSVVVMDPRDNSILAIASRPSFDPGQFITGVTDAQWQALNGPTNPLLFRATTSGYPTGSIFKVITMAAGMEKGGFKTTDTFDCGLDWNGLPGVTLHNWQAEGTLNLVDALTQSCDPAFYTMGLKLDGIDPHTLPTFARDFGLGASTGTAFLGDSAGTVPDPEWKQQNVGQAWYAGDSVNLAIGQGYLLSTPLQMANLYSALAHGLDRRTPLLVRTITAPDGTAQTFQAQPAGSLPMAASTRDAILQGMDRVTSTPQGTAYYAFQGERTPIAAKTGSAENESPDAHAWFAGFMTPDNPTLLALVMVEGGQHGGTVAAPLARTVLDGAYPLNH